MDNVVDAAVQKKQENDWRLCRMYLECVLITNEKNERAKEELKKLCLMSLSK
ncbi:MAG: hypothetical protein Q4C77_05970 [Eubacteriales bacterium]|nr:hypothetical protein [Eubacteriales bacterium]